MALIGFNAITAGSAIGAAVGSGLSTTGPAPTSTAMQVDLAEAPKLIEGLKAAIDQLQSAYDEANLSSFWGTLGEDPYSKGVTTTITAAVGGDPGGYAWANEQARNALLKTIENIEKSMADYGSTDAAAQDSLTPKD